MEDRFVEFVVWNEGVAVGGMVFGLVWWLQGRAPTMMASARSTMAGRSRRNIMVAGERRLSSECLYIANPRQA